MSSSGEFSTLSSGEATGTGDDSLPSSREATAEAAGSDGGYVPLREFLDRFSLPRVVRVEGAGGRPILLYKQQQRSLRVTATLLMHRYRHDVKVGPEIVIPEGYPAELMRNSWSRIRAPHARKYSLSKNLRRKCAWRCYYRDLTQLGEESRPRQESSASTRRQAGCQTTLSRATLHFRKRHPQWWSVKEAETKTNLKVIFSRRDHGSNSKLANGALNQTSSRAHLTPVVDPLPVDVNAKAIKRESKESRSDGRETAALPAAASSPSQKIHLDKSLAPLSTSSSYSSRFSARTISTEETTESNLSRTNVSGTATDLCATDIAKDGYWFDAGRPHTCPGSVSSDLLPQGHDSRSCRSRNRNKSKNSLASSGENSATKSGFGEGRCLRNRRTSLPMTGLKDHAVRKRTMLATKTTSPATESSSTKSCLELSTHLRIPSSSPPRKRSNTENIVGGISAIRGNTELYSLRSRPIVHENPESSEVNLEDVGKTDKVLLLLFANAELHGEERVASTTQLSTDNPRAASPAGEEQLVGSGPKNETAEESAKMLDHRDHEKSEIRSSRQSLKRAEAESNLSMHLAGIESRSVMLGDSDLLEITKVLETPSSEENETELQNRSHLSEQFSPFVESSMTEEIAPNGNRFVSSKIEDDEVTIVKEVKRPEVEIVEIQASRPRSFGSGALILDEDYHFLLSLYEQMTRIPYGWFSVVSASSGTGSARVYRRVGALVRAGVPAFLLAKPLRAYTLTHSKMENGNLRAHYTKTTVRAGEVLRLAAVFQDTRRAPISTGVSGVIGSMPEGKSSRSSERDQYAQCLDSRGHELFAPLSTRGEFYATCQSGNLDTGSDAVLYRVHQLARRDLPLKVRLVAGPLPVPLPRDYTGLMQLEGATRGPIVLGCAVPLMPERPLAGSAIPELLELMATGPTAPRVKRARLGCPSEARLLASPKMQRLLSACRRALDQRATEPRVAPPKAPANNSQLKELNLKEIKSKPETTPILQSLKNGLEHIKKTTIRDRSQTRQSGNGNGFLDKISRIAHGGRSRNPAKKSASFTFAVRPEIGMRSPERYASLESEAASLVPAVALNRQQVQRSVSTSVLEVPTHPDQDPPYSRVRDSLTPLPRTPPPKNEDIYAEICEPTESVPRDDKYPSASGRGGTRERDRGYVKLASHPDLTISHGPANGEDEEGIYNTVC